MKIARERKLRGEPHIYADYADRIAGVIGVSGEDLRVDLISFVDKTLKYAVENNPIEAARALRGIEKRDRPMLVDRYGLGGIYNSQGWDVGLTGVGKGNYQTNKSPIVVLGELSHTGNFKALLEKMCAE